MLTALEAVIAALGGDFALAEKLADQSVTAGSGCTMPGTVLQERMPFAADLKKP